MALRPSDSGEVLLASGSEDTYINFTEGEFSLICADEVRNGELMCVHRKKQFNTGVQALKFSADGSVMFSSAGAKEVSTSPLRISGHKIISVEFGGFSSDTKPADATIERDDYLGGDLRVMGIDVRAQKLGCVPGYLVALVLSDSTVKVESIYVKY